MPTNSLASVEFPSAPAPQSVHPPYASGQCVRCHESKFSQQLRAPTQELCAYCHENFLARGRFKHAPANTGKCLVCHDPHQSQEKFLLVRTGQALCWRCHDPEEMFALPAHRQIGHQDCTICHDPHQGDERFFLRPQRPTLPGAKPAPSAS